MSVELADEVIGEVFTVIVWDGTDFQVIACDEDGYLEVECVGAA